MRNIFKIFTGDIRGLLKNFLALVIAIGLCLLPALYAWFNIYANWDPYGNTGNINIAVVNLDSGWKNNLGEEVNMGDGIVDSLKEKDTIGWIFLDSEEEAIEGVKSGEYYSALVIDSGFTYGMYNGVAQNIENPKITYYLNDKKNAVATKITDSAATTVKSSVNKQFVQVLAEQVFTETNSLSDELSDEDAVAQMTAKLEAVSQNLEGYSSMIDTFVSGNAALSQVSDDTSGSLKDSQDKISSAQDKLSETQSNLQSSKNSFNDFSNQVNNTLNSINSSISSISQQIADAKLSEDVSVLSSDIKAIAEISQTLYEDITTLSNSMTELDPNGEITNLDVLQTNIDLMEQYAKTILSSAVSNIDMSSSTDNVVSTMQGVLSTLDDNVDSLNAAYTNQVVPQVNNIIDSMSTTLGSVQDVLTNLNSTAGTMADVFLGVGDTLDVINMSMTQLQQVVDSASTKINETLEKLESASEDEKVEILINLLAGNPESLGEFFSEPVQVSDNYIYEIENYGSGVAPFYTTLAIWVGMTILVSLVKVGANTKGLIEPKPSEMYFGRYLTFLLLSQIQTLIIVLGDLFILKVQCIHPIAFIGVGAMASLTFSLIIYSLTISFGDIGKAFAVVIMVIQIAGSGGTYPIEALPTFFKAVYIFFPFPYAINAMRECIGGMYENTLGVCCLQLGIFCAGSLFIGLVIRKPFIKLNHFIEERMEDTQML